MDRLLAFYTDIHTLKHQEREGWKRIGVEGVKDTIGSHSFGATLLGWVNAKKAEVDEVKVIKLLLIHDLVMAHMADVTPHEKTYVSKRDMECKAFELVLERSPDYLAEEFAVLFAEYQQEQTPESIIARESDKMDTLMQALMYSQSLGKDCVREFIGAYSTAFKTKEGKAFLNWLSTRDRG